MCHMSRMGVYLLRSCSTFWLGSSRTLPPWASRSWRRSKRPSSRTDMYRCILFWVLQRIYIYIFIAIPTIALTKKILSSSDPHQLTFYLTYITSDIRGLHFFQKKLQDVLNDYVLGKLASLRKMKPHELTFFDKPDTGPASMEMVPGNCTEWYS